MAFEVKFGKKFQEEFQRYPEDQQNLILEFVEIYEKNGLIDFSVYKGKISPSWSNLDRNCVEYAYTKNNFLWHYHIGIPVYIKSRFADYYTSDWVLHFSWPNEKDTIIIVDIGMHYRTNGSFYLPSLEYLQC